LKNRRHALKLLIEARGMRLDDCTKDHWDNMKRLIASKAKQNEVVNNCAMRMLVSTPSHSSYGGEIRVIG
jgi:hypothetical protein